MGFAPLLAFLYLTIVGQNLCETAFSPTFQQFLTKNYGQSVKSTLSRADLGLAGSFGGGTGKSTGRKPIVIVHGITMMAAGMLPLKAYFQTKGYAEEDLYATSYGPTGRPVSGFDGGTLKCSYAKAIRQLIQAVSAYRKSPVDLITYSMGVVISRKAVLGGDCVDTGEDLGASLTNTINTFIGIAGPNHGAVVCSGFASFDPAGSCNRKNGMACNSAFINDINSRQRYEGKKIYVIQSVPDMIVGNYVCTGSKLTTEIDGADKSYTSYGMSHTTVWILTASRQYQLISSNA
uniref:Lipase n=1 Tax=Ditylenchus dipsaci TaxID=166011 RepID=A0A915E724_9BILA